MTAAVGGLREWIFSALIWAGIPALPVAVLFVSDALPLAFALAVLLGPPMLVVGPAFAVVTVWIAVRRWWLGHASAVVPASGPGSRRPLRAVVTVSLAFPTVLVVGSFAAPWLSSVSASPGDDPHLGSGSILGAVSGCAALLLVYGVLYIVAFLRWLRPSRVRRENEIVARGAPGAGVIRAARILAVTVVSGLVLVLVAAVAMVASAMVAGNASDLVSSGSVPFWTAIGRAIGGGW